MSAPASDAVADAGRDAERAAFRLTPSSGERVLAQGPLTFATARGASAQGEALLTGAAAGEIDCSGISAADSAGLAVLIDWLGVAKRTKRRLRYTHLPQGLTSLATISEIAELLERGV
jgi:phospholipid transport system transporter-binding protein